MSAATVVLLWQRYATLTSSNMRRVQELPGVLKQNFLPMVAAGAVQIVRCISARHGWHVHVLSQKDCAQCTVYYTSSKFQMKRACPTDRSGLFCRFAQPCNGLHAAA